MPEYKIKDNTLACRTKGTSYWSIIQNPTVSYYNTKVIYGSSPEIVQRKIDRQIKKWKDGLK